MRRFLLSLCLLLSSTAAFAACPSPYVSKDGNGTATNMAEINDASGNCVFPSAITDGGGAANRAAVKPASTAAVATDPAVVVAISPNSAAPPATAALQTTGNTALATINTTLNAPMQQTGGTVTANQGTAGAAAWPVAITKIGSASIAGDPCQIQTPTFTPISITSATTLTIATGASAKQTYVCSLSLMTGLANNVALVEGTGTNCSTVSAGMAGGTTAANGFNFAANGGENFGSGVASIAATVNLADNVCLVTSSAGPLAGVMKWVQQ